MATSTATNTNYLQNALNNATSTPTLVKPNYAGNVTDLQTAKSIYGNRYNYLNTSQYSADQLKGMLKSGDKVGGGVAVTPGLDDSWLSSNGVKRVWGQDRFGTASAMKSDAETMAPNYPTYQGLQNVSLENPETSVLSDGEYSTKAQNQYDPAYNLKVQGLQNTLQNNLSTLENSKAGIAANYNKSMVNQNLQNTVSKNNINNDALARGLGRSSIVTSGLSQADVINNKALGNIQSDQTNAMNGVNTQQANTGIDEQNQENTLASNRLSDISALSDKLKNDDITRHDSELAANRNYYMQQLNYNNNVNQMNNQNYWNGQNELDSNYWKNNDFMDKQQQENVAQNEWTQQFGLDTKKEADTYDLGLKNWQLGVTHEGHYFDLGKEANATNRLKVNNDFTLGTESNAINSRKVDNDYSLGKQSNDINQQKVNNDYSLGQGTLDLNKSNANNSQASVNNRISQASADVYSRIYGQFNNNADALDYLRSNKAKVLQQMTSAGMSASDAMSYYNGMAKDLSK